jgi:beta-amylase
LRSTRLGIFSFLAVAALLAFAVRPSFAAPSTPVNVMAPLHVEDWNQFAEQARHLKSIGVQAVSVDVWWGEVERSRGNYDWRYYEKMFNTLSAAQLKIVPIMSTHQCGGNVGDTHNQPIPNWIWNELSGKRINGVITNSENLKYKSEHGNTSGQCVALFADKLVLPVHKQFMQEFERHFAQRAGDIQEISLSGGPAGEMRYPSYDAHDGGRSGWPTRGALQAYSPLAQADFQRWAMTKYRGLDGVNAAWGTRLTSIKEIRPPDNGASFYDHKDYLSTYGRDLFDWYNDSLAQHVKRVVVNADKAFSGAFAGIPVGVKLPGVHWQMDGNSPYQRVAEMNAGLIPARSEQGGEYNAENGHGYRRIMSAIREAQNKLHGNRTQSTRPARDVIVHFTCLEMNDDAGNGNSKAFSLATWVAETARSYGLKLKGENALPVTSGNGWGNILRHMERDGYRGINILRMGHDLDTGSLSNLVRSVVQLPETKLPGQKLTTIKFARRLAERRPFGSTIPASRQVRMPSPQKILRAR